MKELFLLRGLPGSGKSSLAKSLSIGIVQHFEADMYFMVDGEYRFDSAKLKEAHAWCQHTTRKAMLAEYPRIIISNTFTTDQEMEPYFKAAESFGYRVHSLVVENRHNGQNTHNVPTETLEKMRRRFEIKL
jgi:predicted kinase